MITNGHVEAGLRYDEDRVPELPLEKGGTFSVYEPFNVQDSNGVVMASFRNRSDQEDFIKMCAKRAKKTKKEKW